MALKTEVMGRDLLAIACERKEYPTNSRINHIARALGYDRIAFRVALRDWWDGYWANCPYRSEGCDLSGDQLDRIAYRRRIRGRTNESKPNPKKPKPKSSRDLSSRMPVYQIARQQDVSLTAIMIEQSCLCNGCGKDMIQSYDYELDHILPISRGGTNDFWNLQYLCRQCNRTKHAKDPFEWAAYCGVKLPDRFLVG